MNQVIVPFTITAAQLNAADTADQTIFTLASNSRMIRVPTRLEVRREAGTAYTLPFSPARVRREINWENGPYNAASDFHKGGHYLVIRSTHTQGNREAPQDDMFYIPMDNILDQARAVNFVAMPFTSGKTFRPGATTFVLRASCSISGGTGALTCRLYYDEFTPPEA